MTLQEIIDKGVLIAREVGNFLEKALHTIDTTDVGVIGKYALILVLAGLLIAAIRLLSDELEEYRHRKKQELGELPLYLRDWALFLAIAVVVLLVYAVVFVLIL